MCTLTSRPKVWLNRAVDEIAPFLRAHPPFETLPEHELARLAAAATEARFAAGETIFSQGSAPPAHVWVVRSGAVELVEHGRLLDLLGPGELFGYAAMLADLPTGFAARASEPTVCLSLPAEVSRPLLARPEGLRFVTRTILGRPVAGRPETAERGAAERAVGTLLRGPAVVCAPDVPIRHAAARMTEAGQSAVVVTLAGGGLGILTDRDLRSRVVAAGLPLDAPVSAAMSAPAYTATEERLAGDVLVEMLDRGVRHFPVLTATGTLLGVVDDLDLFAAERRTPFHLRTAIAGAPDAETVADAARDLWPTVVALHEARVGAEQVGAIVSVVADALVRRLLDLAVADAGPPPAPFAWLALGSLARREGVPGSDVDSALVWDGDDDDPAARGYVHRVATRVIADLERCGLHADEKGATAAHPLFARSLRAWGAAIDSWFDRPTQENALMVVSIVTDSRPVWGVHRAAPLADHLRAARAHPGLLRLLARFALSYRPPTGFRGHLVVEHSGEHRGRLDLKRGGIVPIVDLARWAGMAAGATSISTRARLRAAGDAGVLSADDVRVLEEAFALVSSLRLDHQVEQLRQGVEPDDHVRPDALSPLSRSYLKDAFRAVAGVQRRITTELMYGVA